jgi:beta-glucosidase
LWAPVEIAGKEGGHNGRRYMEGWFVSDVVEPLLAAMTLDEKLGQLNMIDAGAPPGGEAGLARDIRAGRIGSLLNVYGADETGALQRIAVLESRLRIPLLLGYDVLHGHRTIFPIPLAEACAFDPALWEATAQAAAQEATRDGLALTFAPMLDVARDPRWGRMAESPGEDAWLASRFGEAKIRGLQGNDLASPERLAAVAKHIGAYGAVAGGREYASADVSERDLEEVHLPPFGAAARAGVAAVMPSQNDVAGIPANAHGGILNGFLRGRAGFAGVVISDYLSIAELIVHGIATDLPQAAVCALHAGVDIDMQSQAYVGALPAALDQGAVTIDDIDRAVRRVLTLKARLGLFDDPFARTGQPPLTPAAQARLAALARDAARRSIVLLKNEGGVLPLSGRVRRIALVGPLADAPLEMFGPWFAAAGLEAATIRDGLRAALPEAEIRHVAGVPIEQDDERGIAEAVAAGQGADIVILSLGEAKTLSGEAHSRGRIGLPGRQRALAEALLGLGKPTVAVLSHGRPLTLPWLFARADAVLATWFLGSQAGHGIADVLTGAHNPSGRLGLTWPVDVGQIPVFHSARPTGRPGRDDVHYSSRHIDLPVAPQFWFGHGLSYTRFRVTRLDASPTFRFGETVVIEAEVANEGDVAGEETVFLFVRDPVACVARPALELKGVAKAVLAPGASQVVRFTLRPDDFAYLDQHLKARTDPGLFEIFVGPSAEARRLTTTTIRLVT